MLSSVVFLLSFSLLLFLCWTGFAPPCSGSCITGHGWNISSLLCLSLLVFLFFVVSLLYGFRAALLQELHHGTRLGYYLVSFSFFPCLSLSLCFVVYCNTFVLPAARQVHRGGGGGQMENGKDRRKGQGIDEGEIRAALLWAFHQKALVGNYMVNICLFLFFFVSIFCGSAPGAQ